MKKEEGLSPSSSRRKSSAASGTTGAADLEGGRSHDGGIVTIMSMERSMAVSERGGKSVVVGARKIHRNGALGCGLERVSL